MTETDVRKDGGAEVLTAPSGTFNSTIIWMALLTSLFMPVCVNHGLPAPHTPASDACEDLEEEAEKRQIEWKGK